jgi:ribosomal protein L20
MDYKKMYEDLASEICYFTYSDEERRKNFWTHEKLLEVLKFAMIQMDRLEESDVISENDDTFTVLIPKLSNYEEG